MSGDEGDPDRERFNEAMESNRFAEAAGLMLLGVWQRARRILESENLSIDWTNEPPKSAFEIAMNFVAAITQLIEREGDEASYKWHVVRSAFAAVAETQGTLEGRGPAATNDDLTGHLLICGAKIGYADAILSFTETGHWDEFAATKYKLIKISDGPRKRVALWLKAFAPVARDYCRGKSKVTYGQLRARARSWDNGLSAVEKTWTLPGDDKSLNSGFKKLVGLGLLSIPGK